MEICWHGSPLNCLKVPEKIPIVHFRDALRLVGAHPEEPDLAPEHERHLGQWAKETFESDFVAVEGYPAKKRPFYTHPQPDDPYWTNSFDLIFRGLELVTGGRRVHEYADYQHALAQRGEPNQPYESYLQAFRHGMPPHGAASPWDWNAGLRDWSRSTTSGARRFSA